MFELSLYVSLIVFCAGLLYKIHTWFSRRIGFSTQSFSPLQRIAAATRGVFRALLSQKVWTLARVFLVDVLFQKKILREDALRWSMHMLIFAGFMMLLLMHALGRIVTANLFPDYSSTANPFFFLRNLFGAMVLAGVGIALYRRFVLKVPRLYTGGPDKYALVLLAGVLISGFFLEGLKITSYSDFKRMAEDYGALSGEWEGDEDFQALESYWALHFDVVSPHVKGAAEPDVLRKGEEIHEMSCAACHASPKWAFTGYAAARLVKPFALAIDRVGGVAVLWYVHILSCFIGLALLPFSKMFHILATPVSLLVNAVMGEESHLANIMTRQVMELDACTHCGTCSLRCSALMASEAMNNPYILPSEKMTALKRMAAGKTRDQRELTAVLEGIYVCTSCDRCTLSCPSGINLREMWLNVREELIRKCRPGPIALSPLSFPRGLARDRVGAEIYMKPLEDARQALSAGFEAVMEPGKPLSFPHGNGEQPIRANTYSHCFGCQTCTTVCPVVASYEDPQEGLGLLPHQIMWCLGAGFIEAASTSAMVWNCATCYQCQEHCPQNVQITDLFYGLKNWAIRERSKPEPETPASRAA